MHTYHQKQTRRGRTGSAPTPTSAERGNAAAEEPHELVSTEEIRLCAYRKWERAGRPTGDGVRFWLEAEHELTNHA